MGKTILVAGKDGPMGSALVQHFLNQGDRVAEAVPAGPEVRPQLEPGGSRLTLPWSPRSPISAKNLVLTTLHEFSNLDQAWICLSPLRESAPLTGLAPLALDEAFDQGVKGYLYLIRELIHRQQTSSGLALHFVFFDEDPHSLPPVAALHYHGLKGAVGALLVEGRQQGRELWAYEALAPRVEDYLAFLFHPKATSAGRWNFFGERKTLLDTLFPRKETP